MPASMMTASIAFNQKVIGSRIGYDSNPMPGSTPTSVPTRQPKTYHSMSGCSTTEKPSASEWRVDSTNGS